MPEKRPRQGSMATANSDPKRLKPDLSATLAAAKAKAEAMKAAMAAKRSSTTTPHVASAREPSQSSASAALSSAERYVFAPALPNGIPPRTTMVPNQSYASAAKDKARNEQKAEVVNNPYYDPKAQTKVRKKKVGFSIDEDTQQASMSSKLRQETRLDDIKSKLHGLAKQKGLDENSERGFLVPEPPDVEWWDEALLEEPTYDCIDDPRNVKLYGDTENDENSFITSLILRPASMMAPQDLLRIPLKPMYLTAKEQAKVRRIRRAAELKEQQAKIRLGLEPPPPPKVKRGNMMRVMGEQAIADPTAVEKFVETQIAERFEKHMKANEERKTTKEQRHKKIADNQALDAEKGLLTCVFKVDSLQFAKLRYQIDINAKEHAFTGTVVMHPKMNLIIVEGGGWAMQKYKKLMLKRIKWTDNAFPTEAQQERMEKEEPEWLRQVDANGNLKDMSHNKCVLVFEGGIRARAFKRWTLETVETDGEAKEFLARHKLDSMWAVAKATTAD
ncbi:PRP3-domain-containing protein [Amniculicola lignicola CBS 123094]|uniref:PRP3-domain-containing protein n=1 Tax=Amniculicola lignicola CBS 123094 TaxID=1392246 RepID=A0A6A5WQF2_9PLEO|nr:PRP3-domain-containing protein [Amniculicola lignicola CBS 123094]